MYLTKWQFNQRKGFKIGTEKIKRIENKKKLFDKFIKVEMDYNVPEVCVNFL